MSIYFRAADRGFYSDELHGARVLLVPDATWEPPKENPAALAPLVEVANPACRLPPAAELVEITDDEHSALLAAEALGYVIQADEQGRPVTVPAPEPGAALLALRERAWRDSVLERTDVLVMRHRDELEAGAATALTAEQYQELQAYRADLRAWPESEGFPAEDQRPAMPTWLADLL